MLNALDAASIDLLTVLQSGAMRMKDGRVDPLLVLDLSDDGLVDMNSRDASVSITDKGRSAIANTAS